MGTASHFSANVRCGQTAGWSKMPLKMPLGMEAIPDMTYNVFSGTLNPTQSINLGMEVGLGPGDFVFDGDPAIPRKKGTPTPTQFLAHVYCGQTAGWIKICHLVRR